MSLEYQKERPLHPVLQAKLDILEQIKNGNYQKVAKLAFALSKIGRPNQQLYGKLSKFVHSHKQQLKEMQSEDKDEQAQVIDVDDDFVQGEQWDSDYSIQYDANQSDQDKQNAEDEKTQEFSKAKGLFKEVSNNCDRRSVSSKKKVGPVNTTYQFKKGAPSQKKPMGVQKRPGVGQNKKLIQKGPQLSQNLKSKDHRNSAITKSKIMRSN